MKLGAKSLNEILGLFAADDERVRDRSCEKLHRDPIISWHGGNAQLMHYRRRTLFEMHSSIWAGIALRFLCLCRFLHRAELALQNCDLMCAYPKAHRTEFGTYVQDRMVPVCGQTRPDLSIECRGQWLRHLSSFSFAWLGHCNRTLPQAQGFVS
jgi:hypothetical protein